MTGGLSGVERGGQGNPTMNNLGKGFMVLPGPETGNPGGRDGLRWWARGWARGG